MDKNHKMNICCFFFFFGKRDRNYMSRSAKKSEIQNALVSKRRTLLS